MSQPIEKGCPQRGQPPLGTALRRILVTRTDRIGDLLLSTPVFEAIKKQHPNSELSVLVFKETAELVTRNPWIDRVIVYNKFGEHKRWWKTLLFAWSLRKFHFDVVIHLHPTNRVNVISFLAQIPIRIGYHRKSHLLLTHTIPEVKWQGTKSEAEYNFDLLVLVGVRQPEFLRIEFELDPEGKKTLASKKWNPGAPFLVFHPSASCPSKMWAVERFADVADRLASEDGLTPIIIGGGDGVKHASQMEQRMKQPAINLAGKLNLSEIGWLLKGSGCLISNDSGPVHIAAAVGTPVVSIFGRNQGGLSTTRWRPLSKKSAVLQKDVGCMTCLADRCELDFKCLTELSVEEVLQAVRKLDTHSYVTSYV